MDLVKDSPKCNVGLLRDGIQKISSFAKPDLCGGVGWSPRIKFTYLSVIDEMQKITIEKRKRNLKTISPHSRGER